MFLAERFLAETTEEQRLRYIFSRSVFGAAFLRVEGFTSSGFFCFSRRGYLLRCFFVSRGDVSRRGRGGTEAAVYFLGRSVFGATFYGCFFRAALAW